MLSFESQNPQLTDPTLFQGFVETIFDRFIVVLADTSDPSGTPPIPLTNFTKQLNEFGPPNTTFTSTSLFFRKLLASPEWNKSAKYIFRKSTLAMSMMFVPRNTDLADGTYLETSLIPYTPGSSISHVSESEYTGTPDFLMRFALEPGVTIEDLIEKGGNFSGGAIGPRLLAIMNSLG